MYSTRRFSEDEKDLLRDYLENIAVYVCGASLADHDETNVPKEVNCLQDLIDLSYTRPKLSCAHPLETQYFKTKKRHCVVCYYCAGSDYVEEETGTFPMCADCVQKGLERVPSITRVGKKQRMEIDGPRD